MPNLPYKEKLRGNLTQVQSYNPLKNIILRFPTSRFNFLSPNLLKNDDTTIFNGKNKFPSKKLGKLNLNILRPGRATKPGRAQPDNQKVAADFSLRRGAARCPTPEIYLPESAENGPAKLAIFPAPPILIR